MGSPVLELKIVSANDLKKPSPFSSSLQPYVVVSSSGAAFPSQKTPVDSAGGRNPTWNHPLTFSIPADLSKGGNIIIRFQILSRRPLAADKLIGEVSIPLRDLLNPPAAAAGESSQAKFVSYQVKKPSGRSKGVLTFSYRLAGRFPGSAAAAAEEPVTAYPAVDAYKYDVYPLPGAPATSYGYPRVNAYKYEPETNYGYPAQVGYGYGYPGQTGYGYGYGYSGPVVQPNRKRNNGLGLGAGLLGGALAGLVVGDLVSDAAFDFGGGDGFF